jgi:putative aldouronate transport system permease protein
MLIALQKQGVNLMASNIQVEKRIKTGLKKSKWKEVARSYELYLFLLPTLVYIFIFCYIPMYGVTMAFKDYRPAIGLLGSPWVGFEHFQRFFRSPQFWNLIKNTVGISLSTLLVSFPFPIALALMLNYLKYKRFKKLSQMITYAPHFISTVVIVGMLMIMLSPRSGIINSLLQTLGMEKIFFMAEPKWFRTIYVWSGVWQNTGWNSIIYLAALASVDSSVHEAAIIDGADKIKRIWYIDLPSLIPTITILFILNMGSVMNVGFEKVYLMQNSLNLSVSEVISTYVYKTGLINTQFSFSTAVGLFNSAINLFFLVSVNKLTKRLNNSSLW